MTCGKASLLCASLGLRGGAGWLLICSSSPSAAMAGERDEADEQAELLRSLLHLPGCSTVPALSLLRASLCSQRVKIVGILGTVAILLTKGRRFFTGFSSLEGQI